MVMVYAAICISEASEKGNFQTPTQNFDGTQGRAAGRDCRPPLSRTIQGKTNSKSNAVTNAHKVQSRSQLPNGA